MSKNTIIEADKEAEIARTEIARMAEEAAARAASLITELTQSLKAEAERSLSEFRQGVAESHGSTSVEEESTGGQETSSEQQEDYEIPATEDQELLP
jgi:hypothetical protein